MLLDLVKTITDGLNIPLINKQRFLAHCTRFFPLQNGYISSWLVRCIVFSCLWLARESLKNHLKLLILSRTINLPSAENLSIACRRVRKFPVDFDIWNNRTNLILSNWKCILHKTTLVLPPTVHHIQTHMTWTRFTFYVTTVHKEKIAIIF